jgi:hypothetical protein
MTLAPIALFAYNRPQHLQQVLTALANNKEAEESLLYIYCDGAKVGVATETLEKIQEVRQIANSENRFHKVIVTEQAKNKGLASSIMDGVTEVINKHDTVIVLEDDIVTSPYFLRYMNDGLNYYKDDVRVASIHAYTYPVEESLPDTFFMRGADCWGWATWQRGWQHFNRDGTWLLSQLRNRKLVNIFDYNGAFSYTSMLEEQIRGINDSWAVRWHASAFLQNKLTLYPGLSLVQNIGNDSSGVHCGVNGNFDVLLSTTPIIVGGISVEDSKVGRNAFINYFKSQQPYQSPLRSFFKRLLRFFDGKR